MTNVKFSRNPFEGSFNNLVDGLFAELPELFNNEFTKTNRKGTIPVNVKETAKAYEIEVVAPGFEKTDFKINIDQGLLTISAEKKDDPDSNREKEEEDGVSKASPHKTVRREYSYSSFKRSFTLDEKIDATSIAASYINGVLTLNLPKKVEVKAPVTEIVIK